ncbi:orosomucoid 3, isoform CRA_a, partial [Mus musculus]
AIACLPLIVDECQGPHYKACSSVCLLLPSYLANGFSLLWLTQTLIIGRKFKRDDHCVYNSNLLGFQRENGTLFKYGEEGEVETLLHLRVLEKHGAIMLFFDLKDEKKRGLSLSARRPDIPPELREVFQKAVTHVGMDESEIIFVDWKKDRCSEQEKKHLELEKETKKDPEESQA